MDKTPNTEVAIMDLFSKKEENVNNLIAGETEPIKQIAYGAFLGDYQYVPTVALFNEDRSLLLTYTNKESEYPTVYKVEKYYPTEDNSYYYAEVQFLEDYTDKLLGNEMFEQLVGKGFHIRDILIFKVGLLKLRCLNETKQLMESFNEEVKKIEEDFTELSSLTNIGQAEISMWEMSNRMDSYIEDVEKGYLKNINELVNRIITEKY